MSRERTALQTTGKDTSPLTATTARTGSIPSWRRRTSRYFRMVSSAEPQSASGRRVEYLRPKRSGFTHAMIGITKRTDYALLALTYVALAGGQRSIRAREIAEHYEIPADLLAKILQKLARSGLLNSTAGRSGGYSLARPADDISIGAVLEAVEGTPALAHCLREAEIGCVQHTHCTIRRPLARISRQVFRMLDAIPISELTQDNDEISTERGSRGRG